MPAKPRKLVIRTYQVGFGDCFLLSFEYRTLGKRYVLIDFGSTGLPPSVPSTWLRDVAKDIRNQVGGDNGKLHAVVATHRHKDHIAGFATTRKRDGPGDIIRSLKPDVVVQPWTEDPRLQYDAKGPSPKGIGRFSRRHVAGLKAMSDVAGHSLDEIRRLSAHVDKSLSSELSFLGDDNLSNLSAVTNLMGMAANVYVHSGSRSGLEKVLPGVKVHVLGPPTLEQTDTILKQRRKDPDEFWHLQAAAMGQANGSGRTPPLFPRHVRGRGPVFPLDTRWFIYHARSLRGDALLQIVRTLDKAMNNTSVILVFEVGGRKLLFSGDAQIENWAFALSQQATRDLLAGVDLYKVGHHGSLNATPKTLWELFENRSKDEASAGRMTSLMSTLPGKHGKESSGTEVPRSKLVRALQRETDLFTTESLRPGDLSHETAVEF